MTYRLVDLPTESQRLQIFNVHLKGETLDEGVDLVDLSKRTEHYSGSDIKNVCVSAALNRVKEAVLKQVLSETSDCSMETLEEEVSKKMQSLEDWNTIIGNQKSKESAPLGPIQLKHFELALKEVPPSLTDEMQTLVELRKWNGQFGEKTKPQRKQTWGF